MSHTSVTTRRCTSAGSSNPAQVMDISLADPIDFKITEDRCLACEPSNYNYTYGVQVSRTFPGTNANLTISMLLG